MSIELALESGHGVIVSRAHRHLRGKLSRAVAKGLLVRLFPGVLVPAELATDPNVLALAALAWRPRDVLMGPAAARATFWPECPVEAVDLAGAPTRHAPSRVQIRQIEVPCELRYPLGEGWVTAPPLTVLDMAAMGRWDALCEGLRRGAVDLASLAGACELISRRRGAGLRAECLARAAGNPWSVPELDLHQIYRSAGIGGWVGNRPMLCCGRRFVPDVAFEADRVIVEVDGRSHHAQAASFESDRSRGNWLVADGWSLLRFTPIAIWHDAGQVLEQTLATLNARRRA